MFLSCLQNLHFIQIKSAVMKGDKLQVVLNGESQTQVHIIFTEELL